MSTDTVNLKTFAKMLCVEPNVVRRWIREGKIVPQGGDESGEPEFSLEYATRVRDRVKEAREKGHRWRFLRYAIGQRAIPQGPATTPQRWSPQVFAQLTAWKRRNLRKGSNPPASPQPPWTPEMGLANLRAHLAQEETSKAEARKGADWSEAKAFLAELKKRPRTRSTKGKAPAKPQRPRSTTI
jgi:hypothetical protein